MSRSMRTAAMKANAAMQAQIDDGHAIDIEDKTDKDAIEELVSSSEGYSSDDSVDSNNQPIRKRALKSQAELDAEQAVCRGLDITKKEFTTLRSSLKHIYKALNFLGIFSDEHFLAKFLDKLELGDNLEPPTRQMILTISNSLCKSIVLPTEDISRTFAPLHEFNGGIFTTISKNMHKMFSIAVLTDLVEQAISYRENGSAQQQAMTMILRGINMDEFAIPLLAQSSCDQTMEESFRQTTQELITRINELPPSDRLKCCIHEITMVKTKASTVIPSFMTRPISCSYLFDNPRTKGAAATACHDKNLVLSVTVLGQSGSKVDTAVQEVFGLEYGVDNAGYKQFYDPDTEWVNRYRDGSLSFPSTYEMLRASTIVDVPNPGHSTNAIERIMHSDETIGKKLKQVLDKAYPDRKENDGCIGIPDDSLIGISFQSTGAKRWIRLGKDKKTNRTACKKMFGISQSAFHWLDVGTFISKKELSNLILPPWIAYEYGCLNVYILPPVETEAMNAYKEKQLSFDTIKHSMSRDTATAAVQAMRKELKTNPSTGKRTRKLTEEDEANLNLEYTKVKDEALSSYMKIEYDPSSYPDWHKKGLFAKRASKDTTSANKFESAKRKRDEDIQHGELSKKAREEVKLHRDLAPGGAEFRRAEEHFYEASGSGTNDAF